MNNGLVLDHDLMVNQEDVGKLRPYVGGGNYDIVGETVKVTFENNN